MGVVLGVRGLLVVAMGRRGGQDDLEGARFGFIVMRLESELRRLAWVVEGSHDIRYLRASLIPEVDIDAIHYLLSVESSARPRC
jgi:hypothetical protein